MKQIKVPRLPSRFETSESDILEGKYLFRGINDGEVAELEELARTNPNRFTVHQGTKWSRFPCHTVHSYAEFRNGIVVMVPYDPKHFTDSTYFMGVPESGVWWEEAKDTFVSEASLYPLCALPSNSRDWFRKKSLSLM